MISTSELAFGTDVEHDRREEPQLGCPCRACFYAHQEDIEPGLRELYEAEGTVLGTPRLPIVHKGLEAYLHGAISYEAMKTELIETLWKMVQDQYWANCERLMREPIRIPRE